MSSLSAQSQGSFSAMLGASGGVYTWAPEDGVRKSAHSTSVFPDQPGHQSADMLLHKDFSRRIENSLHPQILYLSSSCDVFTLDLRSPSSAVPLYRANTSSSSSGSNRHSGSSSNSNSNSRVLSMKQHGGQAHLLMVSSKDSVQLVDTRFPKAPLARQFVPHGHDQLRFASCPHSNSTSAGESTHLAVDCALS